MVKVDRNGEKELRVVYSHLELSKELELTIMRLALSDALRTKQHVHAIPARLFFLELTEADSSDEYKRFVIQAFVRYVDPYEFHQIMGHFVVSEEFNLKILVSLPEWICLSHPDLSRDILPFVDEKRWKYFDYSKKLYLLNYIVRSGNLPLLKRINESAEFREVFNFSFHGDFRSRVALVATHYMQHDIMDWIFSTS